MAMTATAFIQEVENRLGWAPPVNAKTPAWKARQAEAGKLKRYMHEHHISFEDLQLALAYSVRRREPVESPTGLCWRIDAAKELANTKPVVDVEEQVQAAIEFEMRTDDPESDRWITRLIRSQDKASTLQDWRQAREQVNGAGLQ